MASDSASRSSSAADSYIGCLISLTSKSEIRYEGVLYNINTDESSIGLRNVRSFGTEGRKKDGPQILPGDKVYEYILFRGTDIKDLQVKSSPPVQPTPPINNDPAIIQYPRSVTTSTSLPAGSGSLADLSSHSAQLGHPGSNFQEPLPLYQPGGNIGSWGASSPTPNANGGGLALPMYWQGYYSAPNGLPHLHQQSLLRPPPGLSMPSSMQQPVHFPNFGPSLPTGPSNLPEFPSALLPMGTTSPSLTSTSIPPSNLPSTLPPAPSAAIVPENLQALVPNKAPTVSLPAVTLAANLPSLSPFSNGGPDASAVAPLVNKPNAISGSILPYQTVSQLTSAMVGSSNSIRTGTQAPSLVTPGQLLQSGPTVISSSQPSQTPHKDVEVVRVSSSLPPEPSVPVSAETQPPILPLPVTTRPNHRPGGASIQTHHGYGYRGRGRGRGTGGLRPVQRFTEDFDFMAMNEKFKKDEVWGHLGKSSKSHSKEKDGEENAGDEDDIQDEEDNGDASKLDVTPVYNKDDFFDSLSCNALDHDSQNGRIRYSEQIKIDTETFGDFTRHHRGGWGGRGPWRGGRSRGGYYGRGYGYAGRGRGGRGMSSRPS
ncbi:protein decapping 5-like isoform X2 [Gastrolobium bilobum]|uniref:protein decapping 5-like isoform X2 n=1 Tax=Gastrolobium bilobum TaxID=150636 RepID=UPI002AAF56E0|nr:protein decapping 5-like isoform X2 [Gastrolobium bilobum]